MKDTEVEEFLEHFGVKGMKWGVRNKRSPRLAPGIKTSVKTGNKLGKIIKGRREKKRAEKAEKEKAANQFREKLMQDIGKRSPSELYYTTGQQGRLVQTGEELVAALKMGVKVTSVVSTGSKINDGR